MQDRLQSADDALGQLDQLAPLDRVRERPRRRRADRHHDLVVVLAVPRRHAGEHFVGDGRQREDIGARVDLLRHDLLRGHVLGRTDGLAGLRQPHVPHLGDTEVEQAHAAVAGEEHVRRLHVAVHDVVLVRVLQRVGDADEHADPIAQGEVAILDGLPQLEAVEHLHRDPRVLVTPPRREHFHDVRVVEHRRDLDLLIEAADQPLARAAREHLERHGHSGLELDTGVDDTHAASTELAGDLVALDRRRGLHEQRVVQGRQR